MFDIQNNESMNNKISYVVPKKYYDTQHESKQ